MRRILIKLLLFISFSCLTFTVICYGQGTCNHPDTRAWIRIGDANSHVDTLWFGVADGGTCGYDSSLCEINAAEPCGAPADVFCTCWIICDTRQVLLTYNYRGFNSTSQVDTFHLAFHAGPPDPRYPIKFSWSKVEATSLFDSVVIKDHFGGFFYYCRMDLIDSLIVNNSAITDLDIYGYGAHVTSTPLEHNAVPEEAILYQNYPNPFNPLTSIRYSLIQQAKVTIRIFDILGCLVQTLVDHVQPAGNYTVNWNSDNIPSGTYYYCLEADGVTQTKKLIIIK